MTRLTEKLQIGKSVRVASNMVYLLTGRPTLHARAVSREDCLPNRLREPAQALVVTATHEKRQPRTECFLDIGLLRATICDTGPKISYERCRVFAWRRAEYFSVGRLIAVGTRKRCGRQADNIRLGEERFRRPFGGTVTTVTASFVVSFHGVTQTPAFIMASLVALLLGFRHTERSVPDLSRQDLPA